MSLLDALLAIVDGGNTADGAGTVIQNLVDDMRSNLELAGHLCDGSPSKIMKSPVGNFDRQRLCARNLQRLSDVGILFWHPQLAPPDFDHCPVEPFFRPGVAA